MKHIICSAVFALLLASVPAQAQLTPVYGSLRGALENSMAQALPPYGKSDQATASANQDQSASVPGRRGPDTAMNDTSMNGTASANPPRNSDRPAP
jgi:hypothetical protein